MAAPASETLFRRKYPRRKFRRSLGLLFRGSYQIGMAEEIGEGGISFSHSTKMIEGDHLVVSFQIPHSPFICVQAEIRNVRTLPNGQFLYGCSFAVLNFENKREVRNFVNARSTTEQ